MQKILQIGMVGHSFLLQQNILRFQQIQQQWPDQITAIPVCHPIQLAQLDGLIITGWQYQNICRYLLPLCKSLRPRMESLSLWGIAAGAAALGRNGILPVIDCTIASRAEPKAVTTSILKFPGYAEERFTGCFVPDIVFSSPAPNLGILCQNQSRGIIAVRQGNHLASSFAAELTPQPYLYQYWLEMVTDLKESQA